RRLRLSRDTPFSGTPERLVCKRRKARAKSRLMVARPGLVVCHVQQPLSSGAFVVRWTRVLGERPAPRTPFLRQFPTGYTGICYAGTVCFAVRFVILRAKTTPCRF